MDKNGDFDFRVGSLKVLENYVLRKYQKIDFPPHITYLSFHRHMVQIQHTDRIPRSFNHWIVAVNTRDIVNTPLPVHMPSATYNLSIRSSCIHFLDLLREETCKISGCVRSRCRWSAVEWSPAFASEMREDSIDGITDLAAASRAFQVWRFFGEVFGTMDFLG